MSRLTLGIRQRVLLITLIPLSMITLLLGSYFISTRLDDAHSALIEKGQNMTRMMATSAEFGMLAGNRDILHGLIRSATKNDEVDDVVFLSPSFDVIVRGNPMAPKLDKNAGYPLHENDQVLFLHPVIATGLDILDIPDLNSQEQEPEFIGWVVIVLSEKPTKERQSEILTKGILLAFIGLLGTFLLASRFGQRITNPILGLTHVVEMLQQGHLETRASLSSTGELRSLAQGVNRLAQRVQESNQTLESRVDKATKRLRATLVHLEKQNQALVKARRRADSANLAKDEFLARMSHELRTPLTSVSGFARLLDQTDLQAEQKEYTRIINLTSGLLLSIIDDILDYSKLESNAIELEEIPFELESCVLDVLEMQTATAHEKGLELIPVIDPDTPTFIVGDPVRLRQILTNLVSNAVKFTKQGHVCIRVSSNNIAASECRLSIVVEDTGIGIPEAQANHLFKAFSQADTTITRKYGGSGLGLVIAKRLTELMAGSIELESEEGRGTRIILEIPFAANHRQKLTTRRPVPRVIVFDKHPLIRLGLSKQLQSLNSDIIEAHSIGEMISLSSTQPDSPVIWGLETRKTSKEDINSLQQLLQYTRSTVILLSGQPLPLGLSSQVIQLRKPPRSQLLHNALSPGSYMLPALSQDLPLGMQNAPKVLVAEDNDFNRLLIRKILEQAGAEVIEAITGEEAVQFALKQHPDIILMDVHMPVMDGIEATRRIRLTQARLPIIALTANVIESEHQVLTRVGVNQILLKPINDRELCHSIDLCLSDTQSLTPLQSTDEDGTTNLERYDISRHDLTLELGKQLDGLLQGFRERDISLMRHHSHQLAGLAGLYELPELEACTHGLHSALIEQEYRTIWKALWQLQRIIEHEQF
ncbi:ATP-binding protein [Neptuniibacter halophilus]|uniref:ATP-binding protein n=1 Tax=Neptuniibacter halophilus TaxID=651666 RepID=UPI0025727C11|nr:ATP-binding protein [Neptuniibacter halophilus]